MAIEDNAIQEFIASIKPQEYGTVNRSSAVVSHVDDEGVVWVNVAGSVIETPTASTSSEVNAGDSVTVEWRSNKLYIVGNASNPSVGGQRVNAVEQSALEANRMAFDATNSAIIARSAAEQAQASADEASRAAEEADEHAGAAQSLAERIDNVTYGTVIYYYTHTVSGQTVTETVYKNSEGGYYYLDEGIEVPVAESNLDNVEGVPITGREDNGLDSTVLIIQKSAEDALTAAEDADDAASVANASANSAIFSLSEIEKVIDVLNWLSKHGQYVASEDSTYVMGKYYFSVSGTAVDEPTDKNLLSYYEYDGSVYVLTTDTQVDPQKTYYTLTTTGETDQSQSPVAEGWYELLSVDEAVSNYISTHLALLDTGLWVQMDNTDAGARLQITDEGIYLHRDGDIIAQYTDSIILGKKGDAHIKVSPENGLEFYQGDDSTITNLVAYMSENKLFIKNSEITGSLRIGQFVWKIRSENRISLRYEPI